MKKLTRNSLKGIKGAIKRDNCPDPDTAVGPCIEGGCPPDTFCCNEECYPIINK